MITQSDLQGHWCRDWIRTPGFEDTTTRVNWMQAGALFADLRIPVQRLDVRGLQCLAELPVGDLLPMLEAEGFAGHITVENSQCTWHRQINWQGQPGQRDVGLMSFDGQGGLIEDGVHADYQELWHAMPVAPLRGEIVRSGDMSGVLIENDEVFLLGIGPVPKGTMDALIADCAAGVRRDDLLLRHFDSEYVMGRWEGAFGIGRLSTNPLHQGQVVLERKAGFVWHALAFDGRETARPLVLG